MSTMMESSKQTPSTQNIMNKHTVNQKLLYIETWFHKQQSNLNLVKY